MRSTSGLGSGYEPSPGTKPAGSPWRRILGCIEKASSPVVEVLAYGEHLENRFAPPGGNGNDLVSVTALAAAAKLILLRPAGAPYGGPFQQ